jgi:hypothetical protein
VTEPPPDQPLDQPPGQPPGHPPDPLPDHAVAPGRVRRSPDPLLLVLAGLAAGVGLVVDRDVRSGLYVCAASLAAAAVLRLALRPRAAGNLVVRSRHLDVAVLLAVAVAVGVLAAVTPFPRS